MMLCIIEYEMVLDDTTYELMLGCSVQYNNAFKTGYAFLILV